MQDDSDLRRGTLLARLRAALLFQPGGDLKPIPHLVALLAVLATAPLARAGDPSPAAADTAASDTSAAPGLLQFTPEARANGASTVAQSADSAALAPRSRPGEWLSAPFGERLLTEPEAWSRRRATGWDLTADYDRVDLVRFGVKVEAQKPATMRPRAGARLEYSSGRRRTLYGVQLEQPLLPVQRLGIGAWASRRTDHGELEQVDDVENSLALLFARQDDRDYFEREGYGAYLAWRVPDFSAVSLHWRSDEYRSLTKQDRTRSFFYQRRTLRDNPGVDEGTLRAMSLRLERGVRRSAASRAGLYHWIELERAGNGLGGDYGYTRALADLRSIVRLSPIASLALRGVAGSAMAGALPFQKTFTVGGVDGLRAHAFAQFRGDQMLLGQAEAIVALWRLRPSGFDAGLHAIAFVDAGRAWHDDDRAWAPRRQHLPVDGGLGLATSEQDIRVYVARDLQKRRARAVVSVRLQRPF
jgi:hypothetical protein